MWREYAKLENQRKFSIHERNQTKQHQMDFLNDSSDFFLPEDILEYNSSSNDSVESNSSCSSQQDVVMTNSVDMYSVAAMQQQAMMPFAPMMDLQTSLMFLPTQMLVPAQQPFLPQQQVMASTPATKTQKKRVSRKNSNKRNTTTASISSSSSDSDSSRPAKRFKRKREEDEIVKDNEELQRLSNIPNADLTEEDKELKKKLRNRQTAQRSRERKRNDLEEAKKLNAELVQSNSQLQYENTKLKNENSVLKSENNDLKKEIQSLKTNQHHQDSTAVTIPSQNELDAVFNDNLFTESEALDLFRSDTPSFNLFSQRSSNSNKIGSTKMYIALFFVGFLCFALFGLMGQSLLAQKQRNEDYSVGMAVDNEFVRLTPNGRKLLSVNSSVHLGDEFCPESDGTAVSLAPNVHIRDTEQYQEDVVVTQQQKHVEKNEKNMELTILDEDDVFISEETGGLPFNEDFMTKTKVLFSSRVKEHFEHHAPLDVLVNDSDIPTSDGFNDLPLIPKNLVDSNSHRKFITEHNAKQLSLLPLALSSSRANKFLLQHMDPSVKLDKGYLYQPDDGESDSENTVRIFVPNIYPMVTADGTNVTTQIKEASMNKASLKFVVPIDSEQVLDEHGRYTRIVRLAEIEAKNIKLTEGYLSFDDVSNIGSL
jgi:hypothetical protein